MRLSRRQFVLGAGMAGFALLSGCGLPMPRTGQPVKISRIGYLSPDTAPAGPRSNLNLDAFVQGMRDLGYVEGQHFLLESRFAEGRVDQHPALAAELLALPLDVIVSGGPGALALREASTTIPVVATMGDAVAMGLAASLARPGGNITGLSLLSPELDTKRLELLKESVPSLARVAALTLATGWTSGQALAAAAQTLGIQLERLSAQSPEDLAAVFRTVTDWRGEALLILGLPPLETSVVEFAAQNRLPTVYGWRRSVEMGGLMTYTPSLTHVHYRAAYYVDRILKGAKPADLPIEQPMVFDFVVNTKTAQALGLTFPNEIMLQVTEVIQ